MSRRSYLRDRDLSRPLGSPKQEAARWLRDAARDYMNERIGDAALQEAVQNWLDVTREEHIASGLVAASHPGPEVAT